MTKEEMFERAEREYPIGTIYVCARDNNTKVTREDKLIFHKEKGSDNDSVYTMIADDTHFQFICDGEEDRWATRIFVPIPKQLPIFN